MPPVAARAPRIAPRQDFTAIFVKQLILFQELLFMFEAFGGLARVCRFPDFNRHFLTKFETTISILGFVERFD